MEDTVVVRQNFKVFIQPDGTEREVLWSEVRVPRSELPVYFGERDG